MNTSTQKIAKQVAVLHSKAVDGNNTARIQLSTAIDKLEKETTALAAQFVPNAHVPLYITPQSDQSRLDYTTWNEFDPTGPYGAYDDNYCRPPPTAKSSEQLVYPVRNVKSGRVTMEPCTDILGPDIQSIINIKDDLNRLLLVAKHSLLTEEANSSTSMKQTREDAEKRIAEYERVTRQYNKLAEMIDGFQEITKRHDKIISSAAEGVDAQANVVAIQQDGLEEYLAEQHAIKAQNTQLLWWIRILAMLLWIIVLALFLLKQI